MSELVMLAGGWEFEPVPAFALAVAAVAYVLAVRRVNRLTPTQRWPASRTACFLAGVVTIGVSLLGPPGYFDDTFFFAHMTQHILLTLLAAPLVVLGDPVLLTLRAASKRFRSAWAVPVLRSRLARRLANPVLGWVLFSVVVAGSHVPAVYDYPLTHPLVHEYVEHPVYLATALLFFYPLLAPTPGPRRVHPAVRVLSLFTVMVPMAFTGFFIYVLPRVAYPFYAHTTRPFGPVPLTDQHLSGALMWSSAMVLSVTWLSVAGMGWLRSEAARSRRLERATAVPGWSR